MTTQKPHASRKVTLSPLTRRMIIETFNLMAERKEFEFTARQFRAYLEGVCSVHNTLCPSQNLTSRLLRELGFSTRVTQVWMLPGSEE